MFNRKSAFAALIALGAMTAGSAHAGHVQWSVSVNLPVPVPVVTGVPVPVMPAPVYHAPGYGAPVPVVVQQAPVVVYRPAPPTVVYRPVPVMAPVYGESHHHWKHRRHHHHHHHGDGYDRHDEYGDRHREDRWTPGPRFQR